MASRDALLSWLESAEKKSYFDILRLQMDAPPKAVKDAFHSFALTYHPDRFVTESPDVVRAAGEVFKRGVEAYRVLSRPKSRARYEERLAKGEIRFDDRKLDEPKPPPPQRTLEMIALTPGGKKFAVRAERFLSIGKLDEARLELVNACQQEPDNAELAERLQLVFEALALEPM